MLVKPIRTVLIGCGMVGRMHAEVAAAHDASELVAVCAPTPRRRSELARRFRVPEFDDVGQMLGSVAADCALVASPDGLHVLHTLQALEAGLHVFAEKPLGMSAAETTSVRDLAAKKNRCFGVNFNRRYAFGYETAKAQLIEGAIGALRQMWLQVTDGTPAPHVATRNDIMFWTLLGHHFDLIRYLCGEVRSVRAWMSSHRADQLIDDLHVVFQLESGALATLSCGYRDAQRRTTERCELLGSAGGIVVDDATCSVRSFTDDPDHFHCWRPNHFSAGNAFYASLERHLSDFLARLHRGEPPAVDIQDAVWATRLAEAAQRSHAQQRDVLP